MGVLQAKDHTRFPGYKNKSSLFVRPLSCLLILMNVFQRPILTSLNPDSCLLPISRLLLQRLELPSVCSSMIWLCVNCHLRRVFVYGTEADL